MGVSVAVATEVGAEVVLSPPLDVVCPSVLIVLVTRDTTPIESVIGKTSSVALDPMPWSDVSTTTVLVMRELEGLLVLCDFGDNVERSARSNFITPNGFAST